MDILSQYKKEHPEAFQEKKAPPMTDEYGRVYTGMIALVIRMSGGRIRDAKGASMALLVFVVLVLIGASLLFFGGASKEFSPDWTPYVDRL